jgi:hypothetical protein
LISITATTSQLDSILDSAEISLSLVLITWLLSILVMTVLSFSPVHVIIAIFILMGFIALTHGWEWV